MFSALKAKITVFFAVAFAAMSIYIKILLKKNRKKADKIRGLKQNAEVKDREYKDSVKRAEFEATQKERARDVDSLDAVNKLDEARGKVDEDDNFTIVDR